MKILYYNWVQFDDPEKRGGGVSVYLNNLISQLVKQNLDVYFLSSGLSYNLFKYGPYVRKTRNIFGKNCKTFEIVNSRVMSPGHFSYYTIPDAIENQEMTKVFDDFLNIYGPFDIIHFHNLEGIPLSFLSLGKYYPSTKIFFTLHNYFPFCPQVNLWWQEKLNCKNYLQGARCIDCLTYNPPYQAALRAHQLAFMLKSLYFGHETWLFKLAFKHINKLKRAYKWFYFFIQPVLKVTRPFDQKDRSANDVSKNAELYAYRRRSYVSALNKYCHKIIAVSQRTESLAKGFNVIGSKLSVMYIGTKHAGGNRLQKRIPQKGSTISFLYMGLMRKDKGFYFLLDVLESLPSRCTSKMRFVIAAPNTDNHALRRLDKVESKYSEIVFYDGYSHGEFPQIFKGVDVGVVPVLWEDNLPQVAIEMVSHGVPIITSDAGGASELSTCKKFVFKAGSKAHIKKIIRGVVEHPSKLKSYWNETLKLRTMNMHVSELFELYRSDFSNFASEIHFDTVNFHG